MIYVNPNIRASDRAGYVIATFVCDTAAELPPLNYLTGYTLEIGSTCHVIRDTSDYEMQSDGTWIRREPVVRVFDAYTKSEIDLIENNQNLVIGNIAQLYDDHNKTMKEILQETSKNRLHITTTGTQTINGVTFTVNADSSITTSGTATARAQKTISFDAPLSGSYMLSGAPDTPIIGNGGLYCWDVTAGARVKNFAGNPSGTDNGSGTDVVLPAGHSFYISIDIRQGVNADGLVFYPMLSPPSMFHLDPSYEPYTPTLHELYELVRSYHP